MDWARRCKFILKLTQSLEYALLCWSQAINQSFKTWLEMCETSPGPGPGHRNQKIKLYRDRDRKKLVPHISKLEWYMIMPYLSDKYPYHLFHPKFNFLNIPVFTHLKLYLFTLTWRICLIKTNTHFYQSLLPFYLLEVCIY